MNASSAPAVEATGLVKTLGTTRAVDGLDLTVPTGSVVAVLGPNGAGKTTMIRILATLLTPDAGTARVFGHDTVRRAAAVRDRIGLTGQYAALDEELTGTENLRLLSRLHGYPKSGAVQRADELIAAFNLTDAARRQVRTYSGGMRRRLDIAASLVVRPDLLFLDEPTTGLDPRSRRHVWDAVRLLVAEGGTVLLTTQHLDEADELANRIAVVDHGRVIAEGTSSELKASVGAGSVHVRMAAATDRSRAAELITRRLGVPVRLDPDPVALSARVPGGSAAVHGQDSAALVAATLTDLAEAGLTVTEFGLGQPRLDEVFLALTGQPVDPKESAA